MKLSDFELAQKLVQQLGYARRRRDLLDEPISIMVRCFDKRGVDHNVGFNPQIQEDDLHDGPIAELNFAEAVALIRDATTGAIERLEDRLRALGIDP